jgi:hypothetical protein
MSEKGDMSASAFGLGLPGAEPRKASDERAITGPLHMAVRPPTSMLVVDAAEVEVRVIALTADDWALVEEVLIHNAQTRPLMTSAGGTGWPRWSPLLSVRNSLLGRDGNTRPLPGRGYTEADLRHAWMNGQHTKVEDGDNNSAFENFMDLREGRSGSRDWSDAEGRETQECLDEGMRGE